jgi:TonB family protein
MPHALLLSPDDQAVSAITGVLEEMSVTCERPLDGVSAAHKLNSQSFDLVLVDCENLPAAKLIFDVCRRGKNGNNPVPIAIVDGRAGLPTAFRLGAELILTKPVAKDQARSTIRTAVSRVRKDVPGNEGVPLQATAAHAMASHAVPLQAMPLQAMPLQATNAAVTGPSAASAARSETETRAAAVSSQLTSFAEPAPSFVSTSVPAVAASAAASAPARANAAMTHSAVEEIEAPAETSKPSAMPARPSKPSDDPVMAELEELELAEAQKQISDPNSELTPDHVPNLPPLPSSSESTAPVFSSYHQEKRKKKPSGALVALLVLVLLAAGFYAAWMYQPGFREIAQPQIARILALAGIANPKPIPSPASEPAKPVAQVPPATSANAPESPVSTTDPNQTGPTVAGTAPNSAAGSAISATVTAAATGPQGSPSVPATSGTASAAAPTGAKQPSDNKNDAKNDGKKDADAIMASTAPLPGESTAIILSSKGAEKRLAHSVTPKYPSEARSGQAEGTVVLKEIVDETGQVAGVRLVEGDPALANAAIQAVKQWRYRPYSRDGKTLSFQTVVIVDFQRP